MPAMTVRRNLWRVLRAAVVSAACACALTVGATVAGFAQDGVTRLRGVVSAVDLNSQPPSITLNLRGSARTISVNSDARVTIEDVALDARFPGVLSDVRVGDALLAVVAQDGRVLELHDFFRSSGGRIQALSSSALVVSGGTIVTPSRSTVIRLNGVEARLSDLQIGDRITLRRNPDTGEPREVLATRASSGAGATGSVRIESMSISATRPLHGGESFDIEMKGTPGGRASFDIGDYIQGNAMREASPGTYHARFAIPDRFNLSDVPIYGHLSVHGSDAPRAEAPTQLSAATTPPSVLDIAPHDGESVNTPRPTIYATFSSPSDVGIDVSTIHLVVNGRDVTPSSTRSATFVTYAPPSDYADGRITVSLRVADAAGNTSSRSWTFTVNTR